MLNQPLLLLNNVDECICISTNKPESRICKSVNILIAHHKLLEKTNAKFPYQRVEVKYFSISPKGNVMSLENVVTL